MWPVFRDRQSAKLHEKAHDTSVVAMVQGRFFDPVIRDRRSAKLHEKAHDTSVAVVILVAFSTLSAPTACRRNCMKKPHDSSLVVVISVAFPTLSSAASPELSITTLQPLPPPPGVSIRRTSPACTSNRSLPALRIVLPPRTTELTPGLPASPPANP